MTSMGGDFGMVLYRSEVPLFAATLHFREFGLRFFKDVVQYVSLRHLVSERRIYYESCVF